MNVAFTDREGADSSPLVLKADKNESDVTSILLGRPVPPHLPALGTQVCAIGRLGWRYVGPVVAIDEQALTYTIDPIATTNRFATRPPDRKSPLRGQPDRRPRI